MFKKWTTLLLVLGILLAIAACTPQEETSPQADVPAQQSVEDDDQGDQAEADSDTDEAMAEETTEEESEPAPASINAAEVYANNCSGCHGDKRQGVKGPSLLPERLTQDASAYAKTITDGRGGMPTFEGKLSADEIKALSEWILTPVE